MLKKLSYSLPFLTLLIPLLTPLSLAAQNFTVVSATVTDTQGIAYAQGSYTITFTPGPQTGAQYTFLGSPSFQQSYTGTLNSTGTFSLSLPSNAVISPNDSKWTFTVCGPLLPPGSSPSRNGCVSSAQTISGSTQSLTSTLSNAGLLTPASVANHVAPNAAAIPLWVQGAAGQTGHLTSWRNSSGTELAYIDALGNFSGGSIGTTFEVNGTPLTSSSTINFENGSNVTITNPSAGNVSIASSGGGSGAFSGITSGTNMAAAMLVGTGASLGPTGSGTVNANQLQGVGVSSTTPTTNQVLQYNGTNWAPASGASAGVSSLQFDSNTALTGAVQAVCGTGCNFTQAGQVATLNLNVATTGQLGLITLAGDLAGTDTAPTVTGLHFGATDLPLSSTAPTANQVLAVNSAGTQIIGVVGGSGGIAAPCVATSTSDTVTAEGNFATSIGSGSCSKLAANALSAGSRIHIEAAGTQTTTSAGASNFNYGVNLAGISYGGNANPAGQGASITQDWKLEMNCYVLTTGSSGTMRCDGVQWMGNNAATGQFTTFTVAPSAGFSNGVQTINTTLALTIQPTEATFMATGGSAQLYSLLVWVTP